MKVAVTGISGYLGALLLELLDRDPAVDSILGLDLAEPRKTSSKLTFQKADVRTDDFAALLQSCDALIHLAFIVEPPKNLTINEIDRINIDGSRRVFEGAAAAGVGKIIHASSVAAYGAHPDNPVPLTEQSPLRPNDDWYYSRAKGVVEAMLDDFQKRHPQIVVIRLRPSIFVGPTVNNTLGRAFTAPFWIAFAPDLRLDLCWDQDVAEAFHLALKYDKSDSFNITGGNPPTMDEVGKLIGKWTIHPGAWWLVPVVRLLAKLGLILQGELEWVTCSMRGPVIVATDKAERLLGWTPRYDAVASAVRFVAAHRLPPKK